MLADPSAERALLATICQYGDEVFLEVSELLNENTFTVDSNKLIYECLKYILEQNPSAVIDIGLIYSASKDLGLDHTLQKKEEVQHLKAILDFPANKTNAITFAAKIKKLEIARKLYQTLEDAKDKLLEVSGSETMTEILNIAEDRVFNFVSHLVDNDTAPAHIASELEDYIDNLIKNPCKQVGISTGFPAYDAAIGGGLRDSTINVIAARPKTGKTLLSDNMGFNIANKLQIPVLNMDTEMTKKDHIDRLIAMMTEVEINKIETGKFAESQAMLDKIKEAVEKLKNTPIYHKSIAGKPFDEQLSIIKRWIVKDVGLNSDGTAKPCVVFYDYLKLMDTQGMSQDMKEYQVLGFMMTGLHNFATKYKIPIVAFIQLNRDGITKESTDTASGSDRIIWLCSNFSIFKKKSDEEIAEDGAKAGNRKLIPIVSRHGPGIEENNYINCHMKGWCAKITEGKTRMELMSGGSDDSFDIDNNTDDDENIDFI
jgi:replicative DNA helicase